jgi:putative solute:sodium symporter small subunit
MEDDRAARYWRANLRLMAVLLAVWAFVSYGLGVVLVEPLNAVRIGGFPLGFWFAQQGSIVVFVVLILIYAVRMDRLERGMQGRQSAPPEPRAD